ncbi:hypothetical protein [Sphingomonas flavescens]|uniref:hypothetical protein n=1 Tax=Sphingomonas flavescens TaxID=3132797 RepID=UPI002803A483|nr:hypothetical protein [Sphingomonas limnosediminicola]
MSSQNLDHTLQLDAVYYASPIPRNLATLVALGGIFDQVHFPGVYLPRGDYDRAAWKAEIERIASLNLRDRDSQVLLGMMKFAETAEKLDGFLVFDRAREADLDDQQADEELVNNIYEAVWGPPREGFTPVFSTWHHKGIPGSEEHLTYPGDYYYEAGALLKASAKGLPLMSDAPGLPIPGVKTDDLSDAKALSAFLALETMKVVLPDLPLLRPEDLMEFREANQSHLRAFRRAMLRYAGEWKGKLAGVSAEDLARETDFLIQTEIVPALDELRQLANDPARPWYKRAIDGVRILPSVATKCFTMSPGAALAQVLLAYAPQFFDELAAKGQKQQQVRRSGLYYLLQVQAAAS